jgi:transposase InsO family protein
LARASPDQMVDASWLPSQLLARESLRQPFEFTQYTSFAFGHRLREAGILASMGRTGDAYDNALCESFFGSLECELLDRSHFSTREAARLALFEWLETWYNPRRRHSALDYLAPLEFERRWQLEAALT